MTDYLILEYKPTYTSQNWYEKLQSREIELRYGNSNNSIDYDEYNLDKVRCAHILRHAATLIIEARNNPLDPGLRAGLKNDLSNYLYKVSQGEGTRASASSFIKSLLSLRMYSEVAEQELRIMYYFDQVSDRFAHTRQEPPKLYVYTENPLQIKELILGPRFSKVSEYIPFLQEQLELMAKETGTNPPVVSVSNIEFR